MLAVCGSDSTGAGVFLRVWEINIVLLGQSIPLERGNNEFLDKIFKMVSQVDTGHS